MIEIGKTNRLMIVREGDLGFYLNGQNLGEILLPSRLIPGDVEQGDEIDVFIYRDSEDQVIATTEKPRCEAGEFAALQVLSVHPKLGAFLDWGLSKDLLLPFAEQTERVREGDQVIVYVLVDKRSNRLVASACTRRFLRRADASLPLDDQVEILVTERTPLGYNAIVDHAHPGLLYHSQSDRPLATGERLQGFVRAVRRKGIVELGLQPAHSSVRPMLLTDQIMEALRHAGGRLALGDRSSPEEIERVFRTSKKAFKQALGALYKRRLIRLDEGGRGVRLADP